MIAVSGSKETSGLGRIRSILSFINDDLGVRHGESLSRQVIMPVADRSGPPSVTLPNRRANVLSASSFIVLGLVLIIGVGVTGPA